MFTIFLIMLTTLGWVVVASLTIWTALGAYWAITDWLNHDYDECEDTDAVV